MTQPAPTADVDAGVAAETILAKIVQSSDLGRAMVERAYYAAVAEKLAGQIAELRAEQGENSDDGGSKAGEGTK